MRILVIAAHPDDEVYGMGGTIAKFSKLGHEIYTLIITEGCSSQYKEKKEIINIKKEEALRANQFLGVKKVLFGDLPDMMLDTIPHVIINKVIEDAIEEIRPEIVFTHHYGDVNKDHQLVYQSTMVAVRSTSIQCVKKVISYQVPSSTEWSEQILINQFAPNIYVQIAEYIEQKENAIKIYNTELREYPHPRSLQYIEIWDTSIGLKVGIKRAEAFHLVKSIEL